MNQVSVSLPATSAAVSLQKVSQRFSLRHEKTLKGLVFSMVKGTPTTETFLALDDVSFEIARGTTVGLIGHNGSGKSTLLKIIGGVLPPTQGQVTRRGRLAALLELGAGFHKDLSGRENIYLNAEILGLSRSEISRKFEQIVDFSGVEQFIDTPMKFYSSGMFARLGFAVAINVDPEILLVDEVLAVGDEQFKAKCLDVIRGMQRDGKTIILVTHSMDQVQEFCDHAAMLHNGKLHSQGAPEGVVAEFRAQAERDRGLAIRRQTLSPSTTIPAAEEIRLPEVGDVTATVESGRPLGDMRTGDTLRIDARIISPDDQPYIMRMGIYSGSQQVYGTSSDRLGMDPLRGNQRCTFRLTDLPLAGGRYHVMLALARERMSPALHQIPTAVKFSIPTTERSWGPVDMHVAVEASTE